MQKAAGNFYRYYRLAYITLAAVTLFFILYFQYSFTSPVLYHQGAIQCISVIFLVIPGMIIMMICIVKYFKLLSGVETLYKASPHTQLLRNGIHKHIRHPLYAGTLLFIWGLFFVFPMVSNLITVIILTIYTLIGIQFEEKKLLAEFGDRYAEYISEVPMLIPAFRPFRKNKKGQPSGYP